MSDREPIVSEWAGNERLACPLCAWDTLSGETAFREHLTTAHPSPSPPPYEVAPEAAEAVPADEPPTKQTRQAKEPAPDAPAATVVEAVTPPEEEAEQDA